MRIRSALLFAALSATPGFAQSAPAAVPPPQPAASFSIPRETPVHLMVLNEVSTKNARPGDRFVLIVQEPVIVNNRVVIAENARAWGVVEDARESGAAGKSGRLSARLLHVEGRHGLVPLSGTAASAGPGGATQTVLGIVGLGPFGLFARGSNAKLKAGDSITGYVAADTPVQP
jgi:hypothetical protein